jgi:hypothetical protein
MTQMDADQTVAKCNRLRLPAADGKRDLTDYWADHDIRKGEEFAENKKLALP